MWVGPYVCVCVCVCACMCKGVCMQVGAYVHACVRVCMHVCVEDKACAKCMEESHTPVYKKKDRKNHRCISLLSIPEKVLSL